MAVIKKRLENLKPGKSYVLTVTTKNPDLNISSDASDSIRFQVPIDSTIPNQVNNLHLYSGLENVMFVFEYGLDSDISKYQYELYENEDMSDEDGPLTGLADANVFTVRVSNLRSAEDGAGLWPYWGRVRAIDTSGNVSDWTPLVETDAHTPLIDDQYIGSLTAAKITAGEIGAHTIVLSGGSSPNWSMIQSSTYDSNAATPSGWYIRGDGHVNFGGPQGISYDGSSVIIGSGVNVQAELNANSITVGSGPYLRIDNDLQSGTKAGMELGDATYNYWYTDGTFGVGNISNYVRWNGSALTIQGTIQAGSISGLTISSTKLYYGTGTFNNNNTKFYVDNTGKFSLGSFLSFDPSANGGAGSLTISGNSSSSLITGSAVNANVTSISGSTITTGTINLQNVNVQTGSSGARLEINSTGIKAYNSSGTNTVSIGSDGAASFTGTIAASNGTIGGWNIGTPPGSASAYINSIYAGTGSSLSLMSPSGLAWFSAGVVAPSISGFSSGVTTNGGSLGSAFLRNISYGASKPSSPSTGDIHFS